MMERIKIVKIGRKEMPSKFKEGETYIKTTVLDETSRTIGCFDEPWSKDWKEGDIVEGDIEKVEKRGTDGSLQVYYNIKNPNKKPFTPKTFGNPNVQVYQIAAALAPVIFKNAKEVSFDDIKKLASLIKAEVNMPSFNSDAKKPVPEINVDKEDKPAPAQVAAPVKKKEVVDFPEEEEDDIEF